MKTYVNLPVGVCVFVCFRWNLHSACVPPLPAALRAHTLKYWRVWCALDIAEAADAEADEEPPMADNHRWKQHHHWGMHFGTVSVCERKLHACLKRTTTTSIIISFGKCANFSDRKAFRLIMLKRRKKKLKRGKRERGRNVVQFNLTLVRRVDETKNGSKWFWTKWKKWAKRVDRRQIGGGGGDEVYGNEVMTWTWAWAWWGFWCRKVLQTEAFSKAIER